MRGAEICVKGNEKNKFVNKLVVKTPNAPSSSSTVLEIRGATRNLLENNFNKGENNTVNENKDIPPSERANLDDQGRNIARLFHSTQTGH
ncbi:WSSV138 [White spot syndrome virus]|uniref:WSSV138 n=1 Tax=White spot syndrome virus TaxID=342409 RepID=A0A2I6SBP7_9VIRU|nr:WSSV138 [White spot syndrome virus]